MNKTLQPLVSIIIPTYNRADLIGNTLDSILSQTYTNWECIVIDDGSIDNTNEVLKEFCERDSRFQYHLRPNSILKGANSCRNLGFKLSKGKYINWFDSDDLYSENYIKRLINEFTNDLDVLVCEIEQFTSKSKRKVNTIFSNKIIEDYLVGNITFYVSGPLWRKSFLSRQDYLFDETISNLDDWDFNLRMLYQKPRIKYLHYPLIYYRVHENSLSHEIDKLNIIEVFSEIKAREKHIKLLKENNIVNPLILKKFVALRYKYFFRLAMVQNNSNKLYFFVKTLGKQFILLDFSGFFKTIIGFVIFSVFNKGYKFLK
jgi:glycosyltransferase involved in cell wall biosynthesis